MHTTPKNMAPSPSPGIKRGSRLLWLVLLLLCASLLSGCGAWRLSHLWEDKSPEGEATLPAPGTSTDPATGLGADSAKDPATGASKASAPGSGPQEASLPYKTSFAAPDLPAALDPLKKASLLVRLAASPPPDLMGLDFRIIKDEAEARTIMESLGYYSSTVQTTVDTASSPVQVSMQLSPGPLYTVGASSISYSGPVVQKAPKNLTDLGLPAQSPATAKAVLDSVEKLDRWLKTHGYPLAQVANTRYIIDKEQHQLEAEILVEQGPLARMGTVRVEGSESVNPAYLQRLRPWREGAWWNDNRVDQYRDELTQLGLFRSLSLQPVPAAPDTPKAEGQPKDKGTLVATAPLYDVLIKAADAPQRTVGGGINYESDQGPGGQAFWEHRNLFSSGERLRAELSLWEDRQNARVSFTKPAFLQRGQSFTAEAWLRSEDTDAYFQQAAWAGLGLERRLSRYWWASIKASMEGGVLRDPRHPRQSYSMFGLPLGLRFDNTSSLLDSSHGVKAALRVTPYGGTYGKDFTALHTRLDSSAYLPLNASKSVILAARASTGSIMRNDAMTVPASIRFYSGGGGSVRGYAYQSLGPRDSHNDPLGGASFMEVGLEARIKITEDIGIVPFLDGGNAFKDQTPRPDKEPLQWGAGLGLRYYTAIGPLRLDVASPLNPRKDDAPLFIYISIGQSF